MRSVSGWSDWFSLTAQGLVYALGSSTVTSISRRPKFTRRSRSVILAGVRQRVGASVEPNPILKASRLHHHGVPVPLPNRVAIKAGLRVGGQRPPVGKDLTVALVVLAE